MASTIVLSITGPISGSKTVGLSDADVVRLINAAKTLNGATTTGPALLDWAALLQSTTINMILNAEQRSAAVAVQPITTT